MIKKKYDKKEKQREEKIKRMKPALFTQNANCEQVVQV